MNIYIYDGTFEGLLTGIYQALHGSEELDDLTIEVKAQSGLFSQKRIITTDTILAEKLLGDLAPKMSAKALKNIFYCFLSEEDGIEMKIYRYIQLVLNPEKYRKQDVYLESILEIQRTGNRVAMEAHRFCGLVRFRKLKDDSYYAPVEPDYNILPLIAPHFSARFADQKWLIHDLRRNTGIYYDGVECTPASLMEIKPELLKALQDDKNGLLDMDEKKFQGLWNEYFQNIAIKERINRKLQKQHMPVRYWKYLVENAGV